MSDVYYNRTVYNKLKHYESLIGLNSQQPWHSAWPVGVHAANSVVAPGREGASGSTEACGGTDAELSGTDPLSVPVARGKAVGLGAHAGQVDQAPHARGDLGEHVARAATRLAGNVQVAITIRDVVAEQPSSLGGVGVDLDLARVVGHRVWRVEDTRDGALGVLGEGIAAQSGGGTGAELSGTDRLGVLVARDKAVGLSTRACEVNGRACDLARLAQVVGDRVGLGDPMVPAADGAIGRDALADEEAQDAQRCGLLAEKHLCKRM
mmetsp:Transcript_9778/g.33737  ORF Transcript_9778/g.33737 Transcript_9778/m.33737 type:complete len:265 (+) Transcript_9778:135-929(+)